MTAAVIKKSELKATREKRQKKLNERQQNEKKKVSPFRDRKQKLWGYYYKGIARLQGTPWLFFPTMQKTHSQIQEYSEPIDD